MYPPQRSHPCVGYSDMDRLPSLGDPPGCFGGRPAHSLHSTPALAQSHRPSRSLRHGTCKNRLARKLSQQHHHLHRSNPRPGQHFPSSRGWPCSQCHPILVGRPSHCRAHDSLAGVLHLLGRTSALAQRQDADWVVPTPPKRTRLLTRWRRMAPSQTTYIR